MGSPDDLEDRLEALAGDEDSSAMQDALRDAGRRLSEGRDRIGEVAADTVSGLRGDADDAMREVRGHARRIHARARERAHEEGERWGLPAVALVAAGIAGAAAILLAIVKGPDSVKSAANSGVGKVKQAAGRASRAAQDAVPGK
jgi:hypothetical protein